MRRLFVALLLPALAPAAAAEAPAGPCVAGGLRHLLVPGRALFLGEIHGTVEGPAAVAGAICAAAERGLPLTVALEAPHEERERIDVYLASAGAAADREALLAGDFWRREYQDGRSSRAMADLVETARRHRAGGAAVRVALIDVATYASPQERDAAMAARLVSALDEAGEEGAVVALAGNVHSRTGRGTPWNPDYEPAAHLAERARPGRVLSLLLTAPPGTAWTCTSAEASSCGERTLRGLGTPGAAGTVELHPERREGHDGTLALPALTASPPAWTRPAGP
jgi:erythromycin esterase-like protein